VYDFYFGNIHRTGLSLKGLPQKTPHQNMMTFYHAFSS